MHMPAWIVLRTAQQTEVHWLDEVDSAPKTQQIRRPVVNVNNIKKRMYEGFESATYGVTMIASIHNIKANLKYFDNTTHMMQRRANFTLILTAAN